MLFRVDAKLNAFLRHQLLVSIARGWSSDARSALDALGGLGGVW
ncbi:MAG: hypothetical protein ACYCY2_08060 [Acidithiobacillus ferriphilus]